MGQVGQHVPDHPDQPLKQLVRALARQAARELAQQSDTDTRPTSGASQEGGSDDGP